MNAGRHRRARWRAAHPRLQLALTAVKAVSLGALLSLMVAAGIQTMSPSGGARTESVDEAYQRVVERAVTDHRCSFNGFDDGSPVSSALIRTERGHVRVVSFEKGWDVYNGNRPGDLIAVCLDDRETALDQVLRVKQRVKS